MSYRKFGGPPKERARSPLRRFLGEHHLDKATLAAVLRLAEFLDIDTDFMPNDTERGFRRRITRSILRWEKQYSRTGSGGAPRSPRCT